MDSADRVRNFFDKFYGEPVSFNASEFDSVKGYFEKRGFDENSSQSITGILLTQAKKENIPAFQLINTLKGIDDVQLSFVVNQILNYSRQKNTVLGYKREQPPEMFESRNIVY